MENRLKILKKTLNMGWGELASAMGVSRSMLDQVRNGKRCFGPKAMRQLEALEERAGLRECLRQAPQVDGDLVADIRTIRTHLAGVDKALERIAAALEKIMAKQEKVK